MRWVNNSHAEMRYALFHSLPGILKHLCFGPKAVLYLALNRYSETLEVYQYIGDPTARPVNKAAERLFGDCNYSSLG